jgi:hypothetical protein
MNQRTVADLLEGALEVCAVPSSERELVRILVRDLKKAVHRYGVTELHRAVEFIERSEHQLCAVVFLFAVLGRAFDKFCARHPEFMGGDCDDELPTRSVGPSVN